MIRSVPFHAEHLNLIQPTEIFLGEVSTINPAQAQYAHTVLFNDTLIGCIGGRELCEGVVEVWAFFSKAIYSKPVAFCKFINETLDVYEKTLNTHRIQAYVRTGFPMAKRWAEHLGFKEEGIMLKFGPDKSDYYMMGRVRGT